MSARRHTMVVVAALAVAAVGLRAVAFAGTELYADEAYYWLWSLRPAAGYYDHPPLVAWLIRAGGAVLPGEAGVRLAALALGGLTVLFAALLGRELSDDPRAPAWAALLTLSAPLLHVLGAMALPDAPLVAAYTAALWLLARARGARWAWAGVAVGVALLSKYTAGLLAPALLVLVAWDPELRAELRTRWPWLGALVAVALFAPCLAWNAAHDWVSLRFQLGHAFAQRATGESFLEFVAGQALGAGPVALLLGLAFLFRPRTSAARRVAAGVLVPLAVTVWSATRGKVEANWPALIYPALAAAAAAWLLRVRPGLGRGTVGAAVALSIVLLGAFAVEQRRPRLLAGTPAVERFHGWRALADEVRRLAPAACAAAGCDPARPFVFAASYQVASELAFYGGYRRLGPAAERPSQLDVWGAQPAPGEPFLFVASSPGGEALRAAVPAAGEGATLRGAAAVPGVRAREVSVTPFARYAGGLVRR